MTVKTSTPSINMKPIFPITFSSSSCINALQPVNFVRIGVSLRNALPLHFIALLFLHLFPLLVLAKTQLDPVCFPLGSELTTLSTKRTKIGFAEFAGHFSTPPIFYLANTKSLNKDYSYYFENDYWEMTRTLYDDESDIESCNPDNYSYEQGEPIDGCSPVSTPTTLTYYGTYTYQFYGHHYGIPFSYPHELSRNSTSGDWFEGETNANALKGELDAEFSEVENGLTQYCDVTSSTKSEQRYHYASGGYIGEKTQIEERTNEYSTASLVDRTQGDLDSLTTWPAWQGGIGYARTEMPQSEKCVNEFTKMKYRLKFLVEKNQRYEFKYIERFTADDGWTVDIATITVKGTGTGKLIYFPNSNGKVVQPPRYYVGNRLRSGSISIILPDSRVCDACKYGEFTAWNNSVDVRMNLGRISFGDSAGYLSIKEDSTSSALFTPATLHYFGSGKEVEVLTNATGLRQVKVPQMLADVTTVSGTKYEIRCYPDVGDKDAYGFYVPVGQCFATGIVEQVNQSINNLRVTFIDGINRVNDYVWSDADKSWTLTTGSGLRKEIRSWNDATLTETHSVKNSSDQVIYKDEFKYATFADPVGQLLTEQKIDPQGAALTTKWLYYDNQQLDGSNYGQLKMEILPSGAWERSEYDSYGRSTKTVRQFLNSATNAADSLCRVTEYYYTPVDPSDNGTLSTNVPRTTLEKLLGQEIGRQYLIVVSAGEQHEIRCQTALAAITNADNLITIKKYFNSGDNYGEIQSVKNPDGTMSIYDYVVNPEGTKTTTISTGQPNVGETAIIDGVRTVTLVGPVGEMISRTVVDIASSKTLTSEAYSNYDEYDRPRRVTFLDGTYTENTYGCCGLESSIDREGIATQYWYDALKRQTAVSRNNITSTNVLDANGNMLVMTRKGSDSSQITLNQAAYDTAGRMTCETNALNGVTSFVERAKIGVTSELSIIIDVWQAVGQHSEWMASYRRTRQ